MNGRKWLSAGLHLIVLSVMLLPLLGCLAHRHHHMKAHAAAHHRHEVMEHRAQH